jgi:hypothetical protein
LIVHNLIPASGHDSGPRRVPACRTHFSVH